MFKLSIGKIFTLATIACAFPVNTFAVMCEYEHYCLPEYDPVTGNWKDCSIITEDQDESCLIPNLFYVDGYGIYSCDSCNAGYVNVQREFRADNGCTGTYYLCERDCKEWCASTNWTTIGSYQVKYTKHCDYNNNCITDSTSYQCAPGYYGTNQSCTQCPQATDIFTNSALTSRPRGTSDAGATSQSKCYLPAGTYYDAKGTINITGNCPY